MIRVRSRIRRLAVGAVCLVTFAGVAGCGSSGFSGIYDVPLPGGADVGDHPYQVSAEFSDVLNLVPQAAVMVNHVAVGRVDSITLPDDGWTAEVTMTINGGVKLPANATAKLSQTSLLGEKYVALAPPSTAKPHGSLDDGAVIPVARTDRFPAVEEVLGALSMLLNGGEVGQLHTITVQLNDAMKGNEPEIRAMLGRIDDFVSNLDAHRDDITHALDGLNKLSKTLSHRDAQIGAVLDTLAPGLKVLDTQRGQLVTMLNKLDTLSDVAVDTVRRSKDNMIADLKALAPTLRQLANAGADLPNSLEVLLTYPFTDAVLPAIKGDYLNAYLSLVAKPGTTVIPPLEPDSDGSSGSAGSSGGGDDSLATLLPNLSGSATNSGGTNSGGTSTGSSTRQGPGATSPSPPSGTSGQGTAPGAGTPSGPSSDTPVAGGGTR